MSDGRKVDEGRMSDIAASRLAANQAMAALSDKLNREEELLAQVDGEFKGSLSYKLGRLLCLDFR